MKGLIMKTLRSTLIAIALLTGVAGTQAFAVDSMQSTDAPDLTSVRAKIKAKDWNSAVTELNGMIDKGIQHADVYNLLGFSLRNKGDTNSAQTYYAKALDFDPDHKGALEYQGELFVKLGQFDKAQVNLTRLAKLCPQGCEEREDLEEAIKTKVVREH
jgi:tetratricopeptide (TPR) repeat protein